MTPKKRSESARKFEMSSWRDLTPFNSSLGPQLHNLTGGWRYIKPVFEDKTPACQNACPAGNDIEGWIRLLQEGNVRRAYWHLKREQPFPAIMGRVCFRFCQGRCNRLPLDQAVQIRELERFVGDQVDPEAPNPLLGPADGPGLAIVGSGPAGMSAAYFARLLGFRPVIFEAQPEPGGVLRLGVPAYRLPRSVVAAEFEGLVRLGVEIRTATAIGRAISLDRLRREFDYIFLAPGAQRSLELKLDAAAGGPRIVSGLALLRQTALGERVNLGRRAVIIGGGNTAIDAARTALRLGVKTTVVYRRSENEMPAHPEEVREARDEGVIFRFLAAPTSLECRLDGSLERLVCEETELGEPDETGRPRFTPKPGSLFEIEADVIVGAIGERADLDFLEGLVRTDDGGVAVDPLLRATTEPGAGAAVFSGGDAISQPRTAIHAVAAGKRAAIAMDCLRRGLDATEVFREITLGSGPAVSCAAYLGWDNLNPIPLNIAKVVDSSQMVYDYFLKTPPVRRQVPPARVRRTDFKPIDPTFTPDEAQEEAARCLHCGRCTKCGNCLVFCPDVSILDQGEGRRGYQIDYDYCKGCGICAAECPRGAVTMVDEGTVVRED
ncbi:MAG: FAD-dependent oxidoreductase [Pseudomonadota bacterium]